MLLVSHGLLLFFISFRISLVIDTYLWSIFVILLEKIWKDLFELPSKTFRILSEFLSYKHVINYLELEWLKFCF